MSAEDVGAVRVPEDVRRALSVCDVATRELYAAITAHLRQGSPEQRDAKDIVAGSRENLARAAGMCGGRR